MMMMMMMMIYLHNLQNITAGPSSSAAVRLLRLLAWKFTVLSVVCCQVELSATSWSLV